MRSSCASRWPAAGGVQSSDDDEPPAAAEMLQADMFAARAVSDRCRATMLLLLPTCDVGSASPTIRCAIDALTTVVQGSGATSEPPVAAEAAPVAPALALHAPTNVNGRADSRGTVDNAAAAAGLGEALALELV